MSTYKHKIANHPIVSISRERGECKPNNRMPSLSDGRFLGTICITREQREHVGLLSLFTMESDFEGELLTNYNQ